MTIQDRALAVLGRHLSSINAQNVWNRALRDARVLANTLTDGDIRRLQPSLERSLRLFLPAPKVAEVTEALQRAFAPAEPPKRQLIAIRSEPDVSEARLSARTMCETLGARRVIVQKVATIVSELARNIFMYTPGGTVELVPTSGAQPRLAIRAVDQGAGIPNLEEILGGRYKSRTGLGAGLLGTKRLVDRFSIDTGPAGTTIEVEVAL